MTADDELALLAVARDAADAAAVELRERFGGQARGVRTKSTPTDLVSDADLAAERAIRAVLAERRPGDAILAEEERPPAATFAGSSIHSTGRSTTCSGSPHSP